MRIVIKLEMNILKVVAVVNQNYSSLDLKIEKSIAEKGSEKRIINKE